MSAKEGDLVGNFALLAEWDHGKGTAAAGLPVDREVFGVDLTSERVRGPTCESRARIPVRACSVHLHLLPTMLKFGLFVCGAP